MVTTCLVQFQLCNSDASGAVCHVHALVREIYDHEEEAPMSTEEGKVSIRHLVHAQCQPCFHPRYQSRRTEAAGFWSCVCVENVFCKVAAPHRYIGNILDQHVNVMQKYLEIAPNRRVQVVNAERSISSEPKAQR